MKLKNVKKISYQNTNNKNQSYYYLFMSITGSFWVCCRRTINVDSVLRHGLRSSPANVNGVSDALALVAESKGGVWLRH